MIEKNFQRKSKCILGAVGLCALLLTSCANEKIGKIRPTDEEGKGGSAAEEGEIEYTVEDLSTVRGTYDSVMELAEDSGWDKKTASAADYPDLAKKLKADPSDTLSIFTEKAENLELRLADSKKKAASNDQTSKEETASTSKKKAASNDQASKEETASNDQASKKAKNAPKEDSDSVEAKEKVNSKKKQKNDDELDRPPTARLAAAIMNNEGAALAASSEQIIIYNPELAGDLKSAIKNLKTSKKDEEKEDTSAADAEGEKTSKSKSKSKSKSASKASSKEKSEAE